MDLQAIRQERQRWLKWKNISPLHQAISALPEIESFVSIENTIKISLPSITPDQEEYIASVAKMLKPWRKGPFTLGNLFIDTEWQSFIKYNLLEPFFNLEGKVVGDIGCNNGYYLFRMLGQNPKKLVGFDPSPLYFMQFKFIDHFVKSDIVYELLGVEHLEFYEHKFDTLFCLGVLYHRNDPISALKSLFKGLNENGELILDTFMIDGESEIALFPKDRYCKIPNVYFIPTVTTLKNWCYRVGFREVEVLAITKTDSNEQRKTPWIDTQSLEDFLHPDDNTKTIEGYPAPKRVYIKAKR